MTELEQYHPRTEIALQTSQDVAITRLGEWARSADAAHNIAQTLVQTSFCPDSFRGKAGEATAAILAGLEMGLQPMAALRSFDVISGQAAPRAITLRAVVQSHGHEIELIESSNTRCVMRGRRKGSTEWQRVTWTIDRAKQLNLTGKSNWRNQPAAMLVARATSELARLVAADAILGLPYSAEEVADGGPTEAAVSSGTVDTTPTTKRTMSRRKAEPLEEEPAAAPESPLLNPSSSLAKRMFATMNEAGITDRDDRLRYVSDVIGREVASSSEMTDDDAVMVIDVLNAQLAQSAAEEPAAEAEDTPLPDPTVGDDPWVSGEPA